MLAAQTLKRRIVVAFSALCCAVGGCTGAPLPWHQSTPSAVAGSSRIARSIGSGTSTLYVANVRTASVVRLSPGGKWQLTLQGGLAPNGVATTSDGQFATATDQQTVAFYGAGKSSPVRTFTSSDLCTSRGIALDAIGRTYVGDPVCSFIRVFKPAAAGAQQPIASIPIVASNVGNLLAFSVDPGGDVYVLAAGNAPKKIPPSISIFTPTSRTSPVAKITIGSAGSSSATLSGLAVDAAGNIFVSSSQSTSATLLLQYTPTGSFHYKLVTRQVSGLCNVTALAAATIGATDYVVATNACQPAAQEQGSVNVYDVTSAPTGTATPSATIEGSLTKLNVSAVTAVAVAVGASSAVSTIFVSDPQDNRINGYCFEKSCFGNSAPSSQTVTGHPGLDGVQALWFSGGYMYTADSATPAISLYATPAAAARGVLFPKSVARIIGPNSAICGAASVVVNGKGDVLVSLACNDRHGNYVANYGVPTIGRDNDTKPIAYAGTPGMCGTAIMCNPQQIALDAQENLYVTNYGSTGTASSSPGSLLKFSSTGKQPVAVITSSDIHKPSGVALDPSGNVAVLSNGPSPGASPEIAFFAPPSSSRSKVSPIRVISGSLTTLGGTPFPQIAIDSNGTIYVDEFTSVLVFSASAAGNVAPIAVYNTPQLSGGTGLALAPVMPSERYRSVRR